MFPLRSTPARRPAAGLPLAVLAVVLVAGVAGVSASRATRPAAAAAPPLLPAAHAVGVRTDTLFLGGYAHGTFTEAVRLLASDLSPAERTLVGQHLDRIFGGVVRGEGLGHAGRLRLAYERAVRPDGTTRSIRVLTAEAAAGGALHTAYYFEREGKPGYFDPFGRSLDPAAWTGPLAHARVSSPFGRHRLHPILRRILPHTGVDYAAARGTPVHATGDGIVSIAGVRGGYGNLVEIQHPSGYSTRYAHLSAIAPGVARGAFVRQGEPLGSVGMTGLATGPHLHYEVRRSGQPIDPARLADGAGIAAEAGAAPGWAGERRRLTRLLARTPTMLQAQSAPAGAS